MMLNMFTMLSYSNGRILTRHVRGDCSIQSDSISMSLFTGKTNKTVRDQIARDLIITVQALSWKSVCRLFHHLPILKSRVVNHYNHSKINTSNDEITERESKN